MADKSEWESRFLANEINLADAVFFYLQETGAPAHLIDSYFYAIQQYLEGDCKDMAEPFGLAMTRREKNKLEKKTLVNHIRWLVDSFAEQGYPKTNPNHYEKTAFHKAGELMSGRTASSLYDLYYRK